MAEKPDVGDEESNPDVRYVKYDHDLPKQYCCTEMQKGIEAIQFIQYWERFDEYIFSSYHGYPIVKATVLPLLRKGNTNASILV